MDSAIKNEEKTSEQNKDTHTLEMEVDKKIPNLNAAEHEASKKNWQNETNWVELLLRKTTASIEAIFKDNNKTVRRFVWVLVHGIFFGYYVACLMRWRQQNAPLKICGDFETLTALFILIYSLVLYYCVLKRIFAKVFGNGHSKTEKLKCLTSSVWLQWGCGLVVMIIICTLVYLDTKGTPERLKSLLGLTLIMVLGYLLSSRPSRINWRSVLSGLFLQFLLGFICIRWEVGRLAVECFSNKVASFLLYGVDGAKFVFGDLLVLQEQVFAFKGLPVIFFFSMLVEVLFYWGALQVFCLKLGGTLKAATSTTVCEGVIAVGNIFLGMTESVLLIKPYLPLLTPSELHVVMASGFATVSGTILASYITFGASPAHLVTASVMSAPAAICYSKLLMPETTASLTTVDNIQPVVSEDRSALSAATRGATNGISLILNIIANIVAFVSLIAFLNGVLGFAGGLLGHADLNLEWILGKIFVPLCWLMGVPWEECETVGSLIGLKTVINEFVAYKRMGEFKDKGMLSPRAELIATYSLCGFTNPSSAGIMIGAIAAMAPTQREVLSSLAFRAFFAGCGICFMTACIAGLLMPEESFS